MAGASDCIYHPVMGLTMPLFIRLDYQNGPNCDILDTFPVRKIGCCVARRDISYFWNVLEPSLDP